MSIGGVTSSRPTPRGGFARRSPGRWPTTPARSGFRSTCSRASRRSRPRASKFARIRAASRRWRSISAAAAVGFGVDETERIMKTWRHPVSLDTPVGESEDSSFGDFLEDDNEDSPADFATQQMLKDKIEHVLKSSHVSRAAKSFVCVTDSATATAICCWKRNRADLQGHPGNASVRSNRKPSKNCSTRPAARISRALSRTTCLLTPC